MNLDNSTWTCHICGEERPDAIISVLSFPMKDSDGKINKHATINVRYCNDKPKCLAGAEKKRKKGVF